MAPREEPEELRRVPVDLISANPHQPRDNFDEAALVALAESIKVRGVLQPVLVRPLPGGTYELIAGERRWRAAKLAELEDLPAIVRHHEDAASLEVALIENMARQDLNPVEEARACAALTEELGLSREEVGRRVGRSRVAVSNLIRLLDLPDEALEAIQAGDLSEGHGRALLTAPDHGERRRLARSAVQNDWSVRELEQRARATRSGSDGMRGVRPTPAPRPQAAPRPGGRDRRDRRHPRGRPGTRGQSLSLRYRLPGTAGICERRGGLGARTQPQARCTRLNPGLSQP